MYYLLSKRLVQNLYLNLIDEYIEVDESACVLEYEGNHNELGTAKSKCSADEYCAGIQYSTSTEPPFAPKAPFVLCRFTFRNPIKAHTPGSYVLKKKKFGM